MVLIQRIAFGLASCGKSSNIPLNLGGFMKNNELFKKVEKASYGIFTFFFWYLVIGFFLKSDYPIYDQPFNRIAAYEVLRDGITLSAYFLAPVAALLVFDGWQDQHRRISNEKNSKEIIELLDKFLTYLNTFPATLKEIDKFYDFRTSFYRDLVDLTNKNKLINTNTNEGQKFFSDVSEIESVLFDFFLKFETQVIILNEINNAENIGEDWQDIRASYSKSIQLAQKGNLENISKFIRAKDNLKILYV